VPIFLSPVVPEVPLKLTHIRMSPVPKFDISGGCSPYFRVFGPVPLRPELFNMKVDMPDAIEEYSKEQSECILSLGDGCTLYGDCLITFYQLSLYLSKDTHMFHFWINTSFINNYYLSLDKSQLDGPNKDHKNAFFAEDFKLELYFAPINYVLVEGE
jgi:hypothetical protein